MNNILTLNSQSSLLEPVSHQVSPHHDERPLGTVIDMIVVHGISLPPGEFGTPLVEQFFCGDLNPGSHPDLLAIADLKVSSHLYIKRSGEIIQFVPFSKRAWHAGTSYFAGKTRCNDFSIGIELEGTDDLAYEFAQYQQLGIVIGLLMQAYPAIVTERIVGHEHIAAGRKTDPGPAFDWPYLKGLLA